MVLKRNTRQQILNEAFLLCKDSKNSQFSLSELANRVGISKAAIFRHFKNKENLIEEMNCLFSGKFSRILNKKDYFFSKETLTSCTFEEFSEIIDDIITFFFNNPGFFEFFINSIAIDINSENSILKILQKNGVVFSEPFIKNRSVGRFFKIYFCIEGIEYFISRREFIALTNDEQIEDEESFKKNVINFLWNGLGNNESQISEERKKELDEICKIEIQQNENETRFFKAFSEVFTVSGYDGITVGNISKKLNIAKSSLYSFFKNKNEFIKKMISYEFNFFLDILFSKASSARDINELAYILLRVENNYFEVRQFVFMIHAWFQKQNFEIDKTCSFRTEKILNKIDELEKKVSTNGINMSFKTLIGWISSEIGSLKLFFDELEKDNTLNHVDCVNEIFALVECGIK